MMSADIKKPTAKAPSAVEIYRIAAFAAALLFAWTAQSAYDPSTIVLALLVIVASAGLAQKTALTPTVFVAAFLMLEAFSDWRKSTPTTFVLVGSTLGVLVFNARALAGQEPIRRVAPPRRTLWQTLTTPLKRLFRREKSPPTESPPGDMDEAVRLLLTLLAAIVGGWLVLFYAPYDAFFRIRMGLPRSVVTMAAILMPFALCVVLARTAFWFVDPRRKDAALAEMELNELVWSELRPEMTRVGAFLGTAAAKQPELSEPKKEA
jgi:hypothetical protein